ncbi:GDYXXLXY domain-containing protein [Pseudalkalibacillus berkeleyi]|uniref:GDYXXLXY domain-containing protein n=1 Tax=Pseudalkalibacillus berkeleyi TaxID=1069813 RepID=A0ABS9GXP1_9BACL|nr:GDYXXLXY domain-containing protein [Pseudalkalibacillus berkeleyi]MCF6136297.1 GDYXXLXY domain-containing protein [Pseudalkalibacillus berkeleyi]
MMKRKWFYMLIALQVMILVGIAGSNYVTLHYGERIVLKTEPIDPRDLFHGDYVTLNYDISRIPLASWIDEEIPEHNEKVYVVLKEADSIYKVKNVHASKPNVQDGEVVLKGIVKGVHEQMGELFLNYGIERYYVEEGSGKGIENNRPDKVSIRIAPWGQVTIEDLIYTND